MSSEQEEPTKNDPVEKINQLRTKVNAIFQRLPSPEQVRRPIMDRVFLRLNSRLDALAGANGQQPQPQKTSQQQQPQSANHIDVLNSLTVEELEKLLALKRQQEASNIDISVTTSSGTRTNYDYQKRGR